MKKQHQHRLLGVVVALAASIGGVGTTVTTAYADPAVDARSASSSASSADPAVDARRTGKIKLATSEAGVPPGVARLVVTAKGLRQAKGKVKFTVTGEDAEIKDKVRIKKGQAAFAVPALGTGSYKVVAKLGKRKGKTTFEVYASALSFATTTFTCSVSDPANRTPLSGSVKLGDSLAAIGYVDIYKDGNTAGGSASRSFLGFVSVEPDGTFDAGAGFCSEITSDTGLSGSNLENLGPGTYEFRAYYSADAGYGDYITSNLLTVTVVP